MPLSKVERQVLEVICEEHRQTRRGAKALIVHVGMNAVNGQQKARIVDVLHALQKRALLVAGADSWVPTKEGVNFIEQPGWIGIDMAMPEFKGTEERVADPLPDELLNRCAAMNATLLAQAEQAHVAGDPEAWRDMAWLIETGKQLVAMQGDPESE